jgi:hypothetical protein
MEYYSLVKNKVDATTWMNFGKLMQCEINKKDKYCMDLPMRYIN